MKKILLTIGLMAATSAAFAQGLINFAPGTFSVSTNATVYSSLFPANSPIPPTPGGAAGVTANTANGFYYELLIAPFTGTIPTDLKVWDGTTWKDSGLKDTNAPSAGRLLGGPTTLNVGSLVGWNAFSVGGNTFPNGTNYIMLVGWSANLGTSWGQVSNVMATAANQNVNYFQTPGMFFGESGIGWENPTSFGTGVAIFGAAPNAGGQPLLTASGMTLYELPVPEPATFALVGLGGLSLLLFRRRN
jgi:hypothetical protein